MTGFAKNVAHGIRWNVVGAVVTQVLNIGLMLFLVKYLTPDEFGLYGMVSVLIGLSTILIDLGFTAAIIQSPKLTQSMISTVFWGNIMIGFLLFILLFYSADFIATFYGRQELVPICKVFGLSFVFFSFGMTNNALSQRELQFNYLAKASVGSKLLSAIVAIVMVLFGSGVWSLVVANLVAAFFFSFFLVLQNAWRPTLVFRVNDLRTIFRFGIEFSTVSLFLYGIRKADEVLLGKYANSAALGLYSTANRMVLMPMYLLKSQVVNVLFPAFSKIQDDVERIKAIALKLIRLLSMFGGAVLALIWLSMPSFIYGYMEEDWYDLGWIIQWVVVALFFDLIQFPRAIMLAQGKSGMYLKMMVVYRLFTFIGVFVGLFSGGIYGMLMGFAITSACSFVPMIWYTGKNINISVREYLNEIYPSLLGCIGGSLFTILVFNFTLPEMNPLLEGVLRGIVFIAVYTCFCWLFLRSVLLGNLKVIMKAVPGKYIERLSIRFPMLRGKL